MRIHFLSDIHLEFGPCELPAVDADILVAAGDIHTGTEGIEWLAQAKCPVIYIAGNHEYYGGDIINTLNALRTQSKTFDINFLENDSISFSDTRFLGATLWTDFNGSDDKIMEFAAYNMNDFHCIGHGENLLMPDYLLELNEQSRKWLVSELEKPFKGKTVVITHHAPTMSSWHEDPDSDFRHTYCNDLEDITKSFDIDLWIHGHTHAVFDYTINNVRVMCNPRGYYDHHAVDGFIPDKTIDI